MKTKIIAITTLLLFSLASQGATAKEKSKTRTIPQVQKRNIQSLVTNKSYWETFDWTNAESSTLWNSPDMKVETPNPESKQMLQKTGKIALNGTSVNVKAYRNLGFEQYPNVVYVVLENVTRTECGALVDSLSRTFGTPLFIADRQLIAMGNFHMMTDQPSFDWNLGNTAGSATCFGTGDPEKLKSEDFSGYIFSAAFMDKSLQKLRSPRFALNCSHVLSVVTGKVYESEPIRIWVDPNTPRILRSDFSIIGNNVKITPELITFEIPVNKTLAVYEVSRISGQLRSSMSENGNVLASGTGTCERVDGFNAKF